MRLFFDTETTAKYPDSARLVQLGAVLLDSDYRERAVVDLLVRPDGFEIPAETTAIHGITTEDARRFGVPLRVALAMFSNLCRLAEEAVAHNLEYDRTVLAWEFQRVDRSIGDVFPRKTYCTMHGSTAVCQIPSPYKAGQYKWPKLSEAHEILLGEGFDGAHSAIADVRACVRVYRKLMSTPGLEARPPEVAK